jgi:TusA-related sulfurtransferase
MDLVGQSCATLTPIIAAQVRQMQTGQVVEVISDDPSARSGLASWARLTGNPLVAIIEDGPGRTRYYLVRK